MPRGFGRNAKVRLAGFQGVNVLISTRNRSALPDVDGLRRLCRSLAMLDAILCPDWQYRYHSFDARWTPGAEMASMRDGSGDDYFILFTDAGAIMKGFAHESDAWQQRSMLPPHGVFEGVPKDFAGFLTEPAFSIEESTFCLWRRSADPSWRAGLIAPLDGDDPDGSIKLMRLLDGNPQTYREWAEDYFEVPVAPSAVAHLYGQNPLNEEVVRVLNPHLGLADVAEDAAEIGYPAGA